MLINSENLESAFLEFNMQYQNAFDTTKVFYTSVASTTSSGTERNVYPINAQLPRMREWVGERALQNLEAFDYEIKNRSFELTLKIDRERFEDNQVIGMFGNINAQMGESVAKHPDDLIREVMQSNTVLGYDDLTFWNVAHPFRFGDSSSLTFSNTLTLTLDALNWQTVTDNMSEIVGFNGELMGVRPDTLIVPPQLRSAARSVLNAQLINGGDTNVLMGDADILVIDDLANQPTTWYAAVLKRQMKPWTYQTRKAPVFVSRQNPEDPSVFDNKQFLWGVDSRDAAGVGMPQFVTRSVGP